MKISKKINKKIIRSGIIGLAVLLAASGVLYFTVFNKNKAASGSGQPRTAIVVKGELSNSIEGSGPIASSTRKEISPKAASTVEKIYFKEGDTVKKGDLMFELDDTDALLNIESTKDNLEQTRLTLNDNQKTISELTVRAPYSGQVTELNANEGDSVNGTILKITDTSKLKLMVPFNAGGISGIYVGKKVTVNLQDLMQSIDGTVTYVSKKPSTTTAGGQLYNVEISVENPGSLTEGMNANAEVEVGGVTVTSVQSSTLTYINSKVIKSSSGGTVKSVNVMNNQYVNAGDILVELENDNLQLNLNSTELKLKSLEQQLQIQEEKLADYKLTAPCNGTITTQDVTLGDTVTAGKVLAAVADMDSLEFQVSIDELDISTIQVGQDVKITADALAETTDNPLAGKVTKISMEGTSSNGVTTYPVTISVDKNDKLKAGMNVNGEIITSSKTDVLMVPVEAVTKLGTNSFVYVVGAGSQSAGQGNTGSNSRAAGTNGYTGSRSGNSGTAGSSQTNGSQSSSSQSSGKWAANYSAAAAKRAGNSNSYYANATRVKVETGISNDTYIEIISGLTEGQTIMLPAATASTGSSTSTQTQQNNKQQGGFVAGGGMMMGAGRPD